MSFLSNLFSGNNENLKKNRKRFNTVISDERFNYLEPVFKNLEKGIDVPDSEVLNAYTEFSRRMASNVISLAELHFVITATIASYKPHLAEQLLDRPFEMLVVLYGDDLNHDELIKFIEHRILHKDAEPYARLPNKKAVKWLRKFFTDHKELVERKIQESIAEHYEDD